MFSTDLWSVVNFRLLFWKFHKDDIIDCTNCSSSVVVKHKGNVVNRLQGSSILALIYMQIIYFAFSLQVFCLKRKKIKIRFSHV